MKNMLLLSFFHVKFSFFCFSCFSNYRSGVAMPFGCLTIREKRDYNNPSDVTDKYDLGQIIKSWVPQQIHVETRMNSSEWCCPFLKEPLKICACISVRIHLHSYICVFRFTERSSVRYSGPRTKPQWKCTRAKSSWKRMEGRSVGLQKMRSSS